MRQELLENLWAHKRELEEELAHVNALIRSHPYLPRSEFRIISKTKRTRVRGVLAAARKAVEQFSEPFDKNQLLAKLVEIDQDFANKRISGASIRNTLRLLTQDGIIKVQSEATATSCAKYVKAA